MHEKDVIRDGKQVKEENECLKRRLKKVHFTYTVNYTPREREIHKQVEHKLSSIRKEYDTVIKFIADFQR